MSTVYGMNDFQNCKNILDDSVFVLAIDNEERSFYAHKRFSVQKEKAKSIIVFEYDNCKLSAEQIECIKDLSKTRHIEIVPLPLDQASFIRELKRISSLRTATKFVIDISSMLTPYIFLIFKCLDLWNKDSIKYVINTIPFDYLFTASPFTSFKSYYGNLRMSEIFGYSGNEGITQNNNLYIFIGFEGALSLKVEEETTYDKLYIVNTLPSYYQKYKDISIINNYKLMISKDCEMMYVPATNPFEVYNILDKSLQNDKGVSIAPLCTKPIALGICMYALDHPNVRIVYPFSDKYVIDRSKGVHRSYIYELKQ